MNDSDTKSLHRPSQLSADLSISIHMHTARPRPVTLWQTWTQPIQAHDVVVALTTITALLIAVFFYGPKVFLIALALLALLGALALVTGVLLLALR